MWIATGDIETLDQTRNSVILEAAFIMVNIKSYADRIPFDEIKQQIITLDLRGPEEAWSEYNNISGVRMLVCNFSLIEQITYGRTLSQSTFEFHCKTPESRMYLQRNLRRCSSGENAYAQFNDLANFLAPAEQIWFNGLSFDPPNLMSLAHQCSFKPELWHFRKESDIRTIYKMFAPPEQLACDIQSIPAHTALNDCVRNLMNIQNLYTASLSQGGIRLFPVAPEFELVKA